MEERRYWIKKLVANVENDPLIKHPPVFQSMIARKKRDEEILVLNLKPP